MKPILRATYSENCYIFVSGQWRTDDRPRDELNLKPIVSFVYDAGDIAAEWAPGTYGPLTLFYKDAPLSWSQLGVDEEGLPGAFVRGDYDHIFDVLRQWVERYGRGRG